MSGCVDCLTATDESAPCGRLRRAFEPGARLLAACKTLAIPGKKPHRRRDPKALVFDAATTLDDLREAVTTLEETARTARRVLGDAHPTTEGIEGSLQIARVMVRGREASGSP